MISKIGEHTSRHYDVLLACSLKTMGFNREFATAAAIVYQIDYWIEIIKEDEANKPDNNKNHYQNGKWWVYNTMAEWQAQFPYVAEKTIERTLNKLKRCGIVETGRFNKRGWDRTTWYTLNYKLIENLMQQEQDKLSLSNSTDMYISKGTNCLDSIGQFDRNNTKEYTKSTSHNSHKSEKRKRELNRKNTFNHGLSHEYSSTDFDELESLLLDN